MPRADMGKIQPYCDCKMWDQIINVVKSENIYISFVNERV